jgi:UDPglucose 6-dehydrogenase
VPIGTNKALEDRMNKVLKKQSLHVKVASNPEFLKEGSAINDFLKPDRIIIGADDSHVQQIAKKIYKPFNRQTNRMIYTNIESAELIKYAANSFLATKISFINEISRLCEKTNANIDEVRQGIGSDPRIGSQFLYPGLGYGGSCFPKDVQGLIRAFSANNLDANIAQAAEKSNDAQLQFFIDKIKKSTNSALRKSNILLWGLSFKPETDDIRESLAIKLIKAISSQVKNLYLYDPVAIPNSKLELKGIKNIHYLQDKYSNIEECNFLVICTEWREFWDPDISKLQKLKNKQIFDGRNILDQQVMLDANIQYNGIGR